MQVRGQQNDTPISLLVPSQALLSALPRSPFTALYTRRERDRHLATAKEMEAVLVQGLRRCVTRAV